MQPIGQQALTSKIINKVNDSGVIAVLVVDELKHAVPLAKAYLRVE